MAADDSITRWIHELRDGDDDAAERLWSRYFQKMVRHAQRSLGPGPPRAGDAEDVALSAFYNFCDGRSADSFRNCETATISGPCWSPSRLTSRSI